FYCDCNPRDLHSFPTRRSSDLAPCKAAVPELKETAYFAPTLDANACSNSSTFGPPVSQADRRTSTTAWMSSSSIDCRPLERSALRTGIPPSRASSSWLGGVAHMWFARLYRDRRIVRF